MKLRLLIIILVTIFLPNCGESEKGKNEKQIRESLKSLYGKEFQFTDSTFVIENGVLNHTSTKPSCISNTQIVTFISGDCQACISNFEKWQEFLSQFKEEQRPCIFYIINVSNVDEFLLNYYQLIPIGLVLYYDKSYDLIIKYGLQNKQFQTFMLNKENKIILVGDPLYNVKISSLYVKLISQNE